MSNDAEVRVLEFLHKDLDMIDEIIKEYPNTIPSKAVAKILDIDVASVRAATARGIFGVAWRKPGKANNAYCIPTAKFVRWYLNFQVE